MEPPSGLQGQSIQLAVGKRKLRHIELRAQQSQLALQSADADAVDAHIFCVVEHYVLEHWSVAVEHSQPLAEHARLDDCHDPTRPQHLAQPILSLQAQAHGGRRAMV